MNEVQTSLKHRYTPLKSNKGHLSDVGVLKTNQPKNYHHLDRMISTNKQAYLCIWISLLSNARFCLFLMWNTPMCMTCCFLMMLIESYHIWEAPNTAHCAVHGKKNRRNKKETKNRGRFRHPHWCMLDMKAAWWL